MIPIMKDLDKRLYALVRSKLTKQLNIQVGSNLTNQLNRRIWRQLWAIQSTQIDSLIHTQLKKETGI